MHCAAFQAQVVPQLKKDYIDTGKVKLVFREYPLDGAARMASAVARCFSGDQYFSFIDLLFANQMNWIKDFDNNQQITKEDIVEGLTQMARQAGIDPAPEFHAKGGYSAGAIPTTGLLRVIEPVEPKNGASPNAKTPPSVATIQ